jgi:hypothetical protein
MGLWDRLKQIKEHRSGVGPEQVAGGAEASDPMEGCTEIYASEIVDEKTCGRCAGNDEHEYASMAEARKDYPDDGGYRHCESPSGCRGTLVLMRDGN